jgi:hypothetical protein
VAGSIIAVMGQLAGTIIPIVYGPQDISDFYIDINNYFEEFNDIQAFSPGCESLYSKVVVNDLHPFLRPYESKIHFKAAGSTNNITALFDPPEIKLQRRFSFLEILFPLQSVMSKNTYPYLDDILTPNKSKQIQCGELKPYESILTITIKNNTTGTYPITIQGIGSNGKTRNSTLYLRILNHEDYQDYLNGTFDMGIEINI